MECVPLWSRPMVTSAAPLSRTRYALTFGSLLLLGGRLADLLGRRRLLAAGLVLFALASLACGLARWPFMLITARVVQGAVGAMVSSRPSPAAQALTTDILSAQEIQIARLAPRACPTVRSGSASTCPPDASALTHTASSPSSTSLPALSSTAAWNRLG